MAENLGEAQLRITVNTSAADSALEVFQARVRRRLSAAGTINFEGLDTNAREAGQRAGRAVAEGIRQGTQGLRFGNLQEALDFTQALNGSLRDLRQYRDAVVSLRDATTATAPEFATLNDVVVACNEAIRNFSTGSDALAASLDRVRAREAAEEIRAYQQGVREAAAVDRQWESAIRTIISAQRDAERSSRQVVRANKEQLKSYLDLAKGSAGVAAKGVGAVAKGVGAAAKGAINLGKGAYELGAEFGVFEAPRTGPIKEAINGVIERFRFLGEQATTTRGLILRLVEGAGVSAGLGALAQNANEVREALNGVSQAASLADRAVGGVAKFGQYLADVFNQGGWLTDNGNTIIGKLLNLGAATEKATATAVSLGDQLIQLGAGAAGSALNGLEAITNAIGSIPPEAQAAVLALAGLSIGFKEKPIVAGLTRVTEYLEGLGAQALNVRSDLQQALRGLEEFQEKLNVGNNQPLLPPYQERGLDQLNNDVAQGESFRRISEAIGSEWQRGARFIEKSAQEMERLVDLGIKVRSNQIAPGAPATSLPNPNQYASPLEPGAFEVQRAQLEEDLAQIQAQRIQQQERADLLREQSLGRQKRNLEEQTREIERAREIGRLNAVGIDGKLPNGRFAPGSPGAIAARNKRIRDAGSSALIGGAFPLLFGQGLGAAAGGGLGGAAGGLLGGQFGFGLSLVGTALGTQFDEALKKGQALADALRDPIGQLGALSEASLLSSKQIERAAKSLVESGRTAEAAALVRADLFEQYGSVESAKALAGATDELGRSWSRLGISLAAIASGPLAKAAQVLNSVLGGAAGSEDRISNGAFRQRVSQIEKEFGREAARSVVQDQFRQPKGFSLLGGLDQSSQERANKVALKNARDRGLITAQEKKIADDITKAKEAQAALDATSYRLITAQVQGQKRNVLALRETQLEQQLVVDKLSLSPEQFAAQARKANSELHQIREELADLPVEGSLGYAAEQAEQLNRELNKAILGTSDYNNLLQEQINTNTRLREASKTPTQRFADEIAAASRLAEIESQIFIERQRRDKNLGSTGVQVLQQLASFDAARRAEQVAQANLRTDPFNTNLQNTAREAARAVELSAAKAKNDLIEAFKAAKESVRSISRSLEDSKLQLGQLQNTSDSGLNQFLPRQFVQQRQEQLNADLRPLAESIARRLGVQFSVSGTLEQRNAQLIDLIRSDRAETRLREDIFDTRQDLDRATNDLAEVNRSLVQINGDLASATTTLANKDWNVYVNVPGGSYSTDSRLQGVYN